MKDTVLHYLVTPGICFDGINPSHTPSGLTELPRLLMFFEHSSPPPQVVMGSERRFGEIYRFFLEAKVIAQNTPVEYCEYCDGVYNPSLDADPWVFIRRYPEKTLFLADQRLVTKFNFHGQLLERAEYFVLSHERRVIISWPT